MNILVTGATGMLGATLAILLTNDFNVCATGNSEYNDCAVPYKQFDLAGNDFSELISWSNPDIIIHCAALTNGNYCNENPIDAFNINGISVKKLMDCTNENVRIIYISTDAVFPSHLHLAKETDCTFPESVYGKGKEIGEFFLINSSRKYTFVRTTIVGLNQNKSKTGFVEWIINSSLKGELIGLFDDVIFNPISIWDLSNELKYLIDNDLISSEILHIAGESCTKYEFGLQLLRALNITAEFIQKGLITNFAERAKRSNDQTLDSNYYQQKFNRSLPSVLKTVGTIKTHYNEQH